MEEQGEKDQKTNLLVFLVWDFVFASFFGGGGGCCCLVGWLVFGFALFAMKRRVHFRLYFLSSARGKEAKEQESSFPGCVALAGRAGFPGMRPGLGNSSSKACAQLPLGHVAGDFCTEDVAFPFAQMMELVLWLSEICDESDAFFPPQSKRLVK